MGMMPDESIHFDGDWLQAGVRLSVAETHSYLMEVKRERRGRTAVGGR